MKNRIVILFLLLALALSLCSCSISETTAEAKEKTLALLDCMVARDADGMYALLYPGVQTREAFDSIYEGFIQYCPITEGYQLKMQSYDTYSGIGSTARSSTRATYLLTFDGLEYVVAIEYVIEGEKHGFSTFRITNTAQPTPEENQDPTPGEGGSSNT